VPLSLELSLPDQGIAVTGPNTGGKTVCLKTVGLLTLMAQCGLHIPCGEGTVIAMTDAVLCDIGDSQSISQNLSTFSGHMTNILRILRQCSRDSLVLLDELGSGTDPAEGSGLAAAILEELLRRGCFFLVTTHDPQIRQWAEQTEHVVPGRMAFDRVSLKPLYHLELGRVGESCAIEIARRLGMEEHLLSRARQVADHGPGAVPVPVSRPARVPSSRLQRLPRKTEGSFERFHMGDSVQLLPDKKNAIVYRPADDEGNVIIQLQGQKLKVRHNRLKLLVPASELYPPDYDFSIVFDTVANRKAAHDMARKFDPDAVIVLKEGAPE
jgi:dsDNA-specific endonuclease/ATPase MutS2